MVRRCLIFLIESYQKYISPLKRPSCRYYPTCSQYAKQAIAMHGPLVGSALALWRVLRCNPFSAGGYDPVPQRRESSSRGVGRCRT